MLPLASPKMRKDKTIPEDAERSGLVPRPKRTNPHVAKIYVLPRNKEHKIMSI
jgi:hypothetical protein